MTILCDWQIAALIRERAMIEPAVLHQVDGIDGIPCVSYGLTSAGYDIRLGNVFLLPEPGAVDPHRPHPHTAVTVEGRIPFMLAPGHHVLGVSVERFQLPRNVVAQCVGKSTYARCGLLVNVTPLEPGWCGHLTIELHNGSANEISVYPHEGIAQIVFHRISEPDVTYADRRGKYQDQPARPVPAKV